MIKGPIKINWYNKIKYPLSPELKSQTLLILKKPLVKIKKPAIIDISIVSRQGIRKLNLQFRQIDQPTDVLSFGLYKNITEINQAPRPVVLGEIIICPECTDQNPADLILHSARHLIGKHHP